MEILVVFLIAYLLSKAKHRFEPSVYVRLTVLAVGLFLLGRVIYTVLSFPVSLYESIDMNRQSTCEDIAAALKKALAAKDPDDISDEIPFQANYEVLSSPLLRARYEHYARSEEDAAIKDIFASLPFYVGGFLLAYGLTCNKETIHAGKWGIMGLVLLLSIEARVKNEPQAVTQYDWAPWTLNQQLELLKSVFYPCLLGLYIYSQARFSTHQTAKQARHQE